MTNTAISYSDPNRPVAFTRDNIGWAPWLEPLKEEDLTQRHWDGLTEASRAKSPYFMLLARDPDGNGILDGEQYNTLDASWYGEIAWLSSLYCAAVRAGAAMAREVGDTAFAARCDAVAEAGSTQMVERLFNGEYFVQRLDPAHPEAIKKWPAG